MKSVRVNRFHVRRDQKEYGPGDVIYNLPDEEAKRLAEESNGTIEILIPTTPPRKPKEEEEG